MKARRVRAMNFPVLGKSRSKSRTSLERNRAVEARMVGVRGPWSIEWSAKCDVRGVGGRQVPPDLALRTSDHQARASGQVLHHLLLEDARIGPDQRVDVLAVLEEHHGGRSEEHTSELQP